MRDKTSLNKNIISVPLNLFDKVYISLDQASILKISGLFHNLFPSKHHCQQLKAHFQV